jgi:cell division protein FtsZ
LKKLKESVDSVIVIPNSKICEVFDGQEKQMGFKQQYLAADDLLRQSIEGMSTIITEYGTPNIDFADVRAAMRGQGTALFGIGKSSGENRAIEAATRAINNPLLEDTKIDGAKHFLVNVRASSAFSLNELREISNIVSASATPGYDLKPGIVTDESMGDEISVTVIATGFDEPAGLKMQIPEPVSVAESTPVERNTVSYDEFDSLLSPEKPSMDNPELFTSNDFAHADSMPENVKPSSYSSGFGSPRTRSAGFVNPGQNNFDRNDINTPACMRKNGLSKSINFPPRNE